MTPATAAVISGDAALLDYPMDRSAARATEYLYDQVLAGHRAVVLQLLHDDFTCVGVRDHLDRTAWVERMMDDTVWDDIAVHVVDSEVRLSDTAVVTALVSYKGACLYERLAGDQWVVVDVWQRHGVDWKLLSRTTFRHSA